MYFCYIDESGTPEIAGGTSHFILSGIAIPFWKWKYCEDRINKIKKKYDLLEAEIHTAWILRKFPESSKIQDFEKLDYFNRRSEVQKLRNSELLRLQRQSSTNKQLKQTRKNYRKSANYIHLTDDERKEFVKEITIEIGNWGFARLFCECIDKGFFNPAIATATMGEQAFEQVISRFEQYLNNSGEDKFGIIIHDNNETVTKKHTNLMKNFHSKGTLWTHINKIVETPFFVNSELTSMVQIADVCAYSIRRYVENDENEFFDEILKRADRKANGVIVGIRHYSKSNCSCKICTSHKQSAKLPKINKV